MAQECGRGPGDDVHSMTPTVFADFLTERFDAAWGKDPDPDPSSPLQPSLSLTLH